MPDGTREDELSLDCAVHVMSIGKGISLGISIGFKKYIIVSLIGLLLRRSSFLSCFLRRKSLVLAL